MKILLILSVMLISVNSYGVTAIKKGEIAPHSGFIFSHSEEKKVRKIRKENITLKDLTIKQEDLIKIQKEQIKVLDRRVKNNRIGTWGKILYFIGGVAATSGAVYLAGKLRR